MHFFDFHHSRGLDCYRAHFLAAKNCSHAIPIEATPSYFDHPLVLARAVRDLPDARFVLLLRNPVLRAYSHYWHERRFGRISASFSQALQREMENIARERSSGFAAPWDFRRFLRRSMYAVNLRRWLAAVSRDRLLVLRSEDLQRTPMASLKLSAILQDSLGGLGLRSLRVMSATTRKTFLQARGCACGNFSRRMAARSKPCLANASYGFDCVAFAAKRRQRRASPMFRESGNADP